MGFIDKAPLHFIYIFVLLESDIQSAIVETEGTPYSFELYRAGDTGFLYKAVLGR